MNTLLKNALIDKKSNDTLTDELSLEEMEVVFNNNISLEESDRIETIVEELDEIELTLEELIKDRSDNKYLADMCRNKVINLEKELQIESTSISLESYMGNIVEFNELTLEAISGIWNRLKQVQVSKWQGLFDVFHTALAGYKNFGLSQQKRVHKLRQEWNNKKPTLNSKKHKASMAGESLYKSFVLDGKLSTEPHVDMTNDIKYSTYLLKEYPKILSNYIDNVQKIIVDGKYDNDDIFEKSVLANLAKLDHPSTLIKLDIVDKGAKLLSNKGLETKEGSAVKPVGNSAVYKALADLSVKTHVHEFMFTWKLLNGHVFEDFYLTTKDVDTLLDLVEGYANLLVHSVDTFKPLMKSISNITKMNKKNINIDMLNKTNKAAFKQAIKFMSGLTKYVKTPYRVEMSRINTLIMDARVIASRTIATAE